MADDSNNSSGHMSDKMCAGSLTQRAWFKHKAGQVWHGAIKKVAKCFSLSVVAMTSSCGQQCGQALLPHAHHHDRCCRKGDDSSDNGHSCSSGSNGVAMVANVVMGYADDMLCVNCQQRTQALFEMTVCQKLRFGNNNVKGIIAR